MCLMSGWKSHFHHQNRDHLVDDSGPLLRNYKELSQMVRGLNKLFGVEFYNKDYYEEVNYLFDSLVNGYHINMSTEEVETYCYQLCNYVLKRIEGEHV